MNLPLSLGWLADSALMLHAFSLAQATLASVLAGLLLWGLLSLALRRMPELAARRPVWLAAQVLLAAVFVLVLLPERAALSVLPEVRLPSVDWSQPAAAVAASVNPSGPAPAPAPAPLFWLPSAWVLLYLAGVAWSAGRLLHARALWNGLLAHAELLDMRQLRAHPAFNAAQADEIEAGHLAVRLTGAAVSPMLVGMLKPCLLLPRHMDSFSLAQQQMIVEHELTHWRRRDHRWLALAALLQTLLWFNPALRWLGRKLNWAQELACDRQVLAGRPQQQRRLYASALVQQLKVQSGAMPAAPGLAFGGSGGESLAARVALMARVGAGQISAAGKILLGAGMLAILAAGVTLQPALAWSDSDIMVPAPLPAPEAWSYPLEKVRVSSFYGVYSAYLGRTRRGIDFAAPRGTPVLAVAAGTVEVAARDQRLGKYIVLRHAGGLRSLYAHLDSVATAAGQQVAATQVIGKVGASGRATGPHLHLQAYQEQQLIDPGTLLTGLDATASKNALKVRRSELGY